MAISIYGIGLRVAPVSENWHLTVGISLCVINYHSLRFQELWVFSLTGTRWSLHWLHQGKVAFGNSFVWVLLVLICTQTFIKISHMVEDLRWFPYFHMFCFGVALVKEKWQAYYLDLFGVYRWVKHYQNIPNCLSAMAIFANWPRTDRRMDS